VVKNEERKKNYIVGRVGSREGKLLERYYVTNHTVWELVERMILRESYPGSKMIG
jgi:hypothetical protein